MLITVLSATTETITTGKGSYQKLELAYKGEDGQVKGKKIMSFGAGAGAFKVLTKAQGGESYEITAVKNEASGYWDWTGATKEEVGKSTASAPAQANGQAARSTYETAEERARKQVYIVRQSSLATAVDYLNLNGGGNVQDVINTAKQFEAYVFSQGVADFVGDEDEVL